MNPLLDVRNVDMTGKVCLVTGGNSGIGKATAMGLAKLNASVVIVSRDKDKGEAALIEMRARSGNRNLDAMTADLSSQDSVRELAHDFKARYKKLHVLINNAGIFLPKRIQTVDGFEATFATNHLGHFLLTNLLMDLLKASAPSRIINLTSSAHYGTEMNFEDLSGREKVQRIPRLQPVKTSQRSLHVSTGKTVGGHGGHGQQSPPWGSQNGLWKRPGRPHVDSRHSGSSFHD
jgi:NAD(P)-dependent dehydrogenase (short-subunit alcohol dehydrogenase family)